MKVFKWFGDNIFFVITLFLLAFIPLYPKLPLVDIRHTWVYIRAEDFIVVLVMALWVLMLLKKKISLKTPLTAPILIFWIMGAIASIHAVFLVFPTLTDVYPNVAFLSFLRRVEYMSLFFVAYVGMRDKKFLTYVIAVIVGTLFAVSAYGIGQKYLAFPAFLTMNEEFAKGVPIYLSQLSRVPSTFGGHYDLAAYLVLVLPIVLSLLFGVKNWLIKVILAACLVAGSIVMVMTVSRSSFFVLILAFGIVLFFKMKKVFLMVLPIAVVLGAFFFLTFAPHLSDRFVNTLKEIDVLVDANTGNEIGHVKIFPSSDFNSKLVQKEIYSANENLDAVQILTYEELFLASPSALYDASLPPKVLTVVKPNTPTGENLPQGTGYINLPLSPVQRRIGEFFYVFDDKNESATVSADAAIFYGNFLVKKALAYDLSFTTRFQGEWPKALQAFERNIVFGSGYSSVSLAVDNNYLRILGEAGLVGFLSFFAIFVIAGIYIVKILPKVDSPVAKSFVIGFVAGVIGLCLNAVLIDVFEASKIAFLLWLLTGLTLGLLSLYQKQAIDIVLELKKVVASRLAIVVYLLIAAILLFGPMVNNFFVGDDYTWLRWAADCGNGVMRSSSCPSLVERGIGYFTDANGFFYRPGTKLYFLSMYSVFWLNQTMYHMVSILVHLLVALLVYFLAKEIFKNFKLALLSSFLFIVLSGLSETIFWISSTGHLINAAFILLSLLLYIQWVKNKKILYLLGSLVSMFVSLLFHELGIVVPLLILAYTFTMTQETIKKPFYNKVPYLFFLPDILYGIMRLAAHSHWFNGDYSYNIIKLPFNVVGNSIGYFVLSLLGPISLPVYGMFRSISREHIVVSAAVGIIIVVVSWLVYKLYIGRLSGSDKRIIIFSTCFFFISLIPFLGLGNLAARYSYLASIGVVFVLVFFIGKLYHALKVNGEKLAAGSIAFLISVFFLFHIIQIQQIQSDWREAGKRATTFFISIDSLYSDYWSTEPIELHFVNVPLKVGDAWVFPVGLSDALWFVFQNPRLKVYEWPDVQSVSKVVHGGKNQKIFVFDETGAVTEETIDVNE